MRTKFFGIWAKNQDKKRRAAWLAEEKLAGRGLSSDIDWFGVNLLVALYIIALMALAVTSEKGTDDYYNMQNGLATGIVIALLLMLERRSVMHIFLG